VTYQQNKSDYCYLCLEKASSSKVPLFNQLTMRHIPKDTNRYQHHCHTLKSCQHFLKHSIKACDKTPTILDLGTRCRWAFSFILVLEARKGVCLIPKIPFISHTWLKWQQSHFIQNISGFLELFLSCGKKKERENKNEEEEVSVSCSHPVLVIEN